MRTPLLPPLLLLAGACGSSRGAPVSSADAASDAGPTLAPTELAFDFLPINSIRGEVVGHDAAADVCVRVIWDFSNHNKLPVRKHCDDFFEGFPYVSISPGACTPGVAYWGNVQLVSGAGCIDFGNFDDAPPLVDVTLQVSGPAFTGTIRMKS